MSDLFSEIEGAKNSYDTLKDKANSAKCLWRDKRNKAWRLLGVPIPPPTTKQNATLLKIHSYLLLGLIVVLPLFLLLGGFIIPVVIGFIVALILTWPIVKWGDTGNP